MLAKTPPQPSSLKPPRTGGKLFLPGFHRTKQPEDVASIAYDVLRLSNVGSLYGRGFYMTRTLSAQRRTTMQSYGRWIVRCSVDVSRFICFDRSVAYRVWGLRGFSLKAQLAHFGPWTPDQQKKINAWSKQLSLFWNKGPYKIGEKRSKVLGTRDEMLTHSAIVARMVYEGLSLDKRVPGIVYTGKRDGVCVLAYDLQRVQPLKCQDEKFSQGKKAKKLTWDDFSDTRLRYKLNPALAFDDNIQTYQVSFERQAPLTENDVLMGWFAMKKQTVIERWAYLAAFYKFATRKPHYTKIRKALADVVFTDPEMMDYLELRAFPELTATGSDFYDGNVKTYLSRIDRRAKDAHGRLVERITKSSTLLRARVMREYIGPALREMFLFLKAIKKRILSYNTVERRHEIVSKIFSLNLGRYYTGRKAFHRRMVQNLDAYANDTWCPASQSHKYVVLDQVEGIAETLFARLLFKFCEALLKEPIIQKDGALNTALISWTYAYKQYKKDIPLAFKPYLK